MTTNPSYLFFIKSNWSGAIPLQIISDLLKLN
jgi:hypothetical protein